MPEPFKNFFNEPLIISMGDHLTKSWPDFQTTAFVAQALENFEQLELKERSTQISQALSEFLPEDFTEASEILRNSLAPEKNKSSLNEQAPSGSLGIEGWGIMPLTSYVARHGLEHFDLSLSLLQEMTKRFSAEFDIRFFLISDPERTLTTLTTWLDHPSHHVRRLISEGTRPRLPWAVQLPEFIKDPSPILPLLDALKDDDEEYVRRSVANNLNDIAKDHPDMVADIAEKWGRGANKNRQKLIRHACRTLIKQGHQKTLAALGYSAPDITIDSLTINTPNVIFGNALNFDLSLTSQSEKPQSLIIDYAIHHRKANGKTSAKVFKWKNITLKPAASHSAQKKHVIKKITTRKYYPGQHHLEIFINGQSYGLRDFELIIDP